MTTANKITIARIFVIPLFVMMAIYYGRSVQAGEPEEWQRWSAVALFLIAAASDGVDGYIARRYNQRSRLGVILDPIADKGLLLAAIITLSVSNWRFELPVWFPVLVIAGCHRRDGRGCPAHAQRFRAREAELAGKDRDRSSDGGHRLHHAAARSLSH
jgi:CDP-diacylglycerol--glycerol-3-phosphate 3-phosphatidyltransferase